MIAQCNKPFHVREIAEIVLGRADFLAKPDRVLLDQVLDKGVRPDEIAAAAGRSVRTIQRRVRDLALRPQHPAVVYVLRNHRKWPTTRRAIALAHWVRHERLRDIADRLDLSLYEVRQHVQSLRGLIDEGVRRRAQYERRAAHAQA